MRLTRKKRKNSTPKQATPPLPPEEEDEEPRATPDPQIKRAIDRCTNWAAQVTAPGGKGEGPVPEESADLLKRAQDAKAARTRSHWPLWLKTQGT